MSTTNTQQSIKKGGDVAGDPVTNTRAIRLQKKMELGHTRRQKTKMKAACIHEDNKTRQEQEQEQEEKRGKNHKIKQIH